MKSRITIEVDFENNNEPVIHLISQPSNDVRDKLVSQFLNNLQHTSIWLNITFDSEIGTSQEDRGTRWKISPIKIENFKDQAEIMLEQFRLHKQQVNS